VLARDVAQELGQLAEGGSNLDQLAGAGAAVGLAEAVLAVPALDRGARAGRRPRAARRAVQAVAVVGAHDLELELAGDLDPARCGARLADRGGGGAGGPGPARSPRARRSVLAGDVAQVLGQLAEGGGNLWLKIPGRPRMAMRIALAGSACLRIH